MDQATKIATVTLNPAIDQTVSIPGFAVGQVNRVQQSQSDPGGKGVNVASVLADYGFPIVATGFLGEDNALIFERLFARKQIQDRFVRIAGSTRIGIKVVDEAGQATTEINFPGRAPTSADVASLRQIVVELATDCHWFVLAGSIPAGCSPEIYADLVQLIKGKTRKVALDTSGQGLRLALPALPSLVKPNIDELQELLGRHLATQEEVIGAARAWLDTGIETVVVSLGAEGAIFVEAGQGILARPPRVTVKSTVGAGDAMVSGIVAGRALGYPLDECARLATAFSLAAITRVGSGLPPLDVVEAFKSQVAVQRLR